MPARTTVAYTGLTDLRICMFDLLEQYMSSNWTDRLIGLTTILLKRSSLLICHVL